MTRDAEQGSAGGAKPDVVLPALGLLGTLRWAWTQLTSMRTALFLLLLLAVGAVPGSLFPQRSANPAVVTQYLQENPTSGPILDWFQMFDVYSSVWFSAIYLLLFISLIGCVIPRAIAHFKAVRSTPPRTPKRLSRLPVHGTIEVPAARARATGLTPMLAAEQAAALLKKRGYRVDVRDTATGTPSVGAERGLTKELGNLVFHTSLIGVLVSVAVGGLFGYNGQKVLVEGESFVNTLIGYDSFDPGSNFTGDQLDPYSLRLDSFDVRFDREQESHYGQPLDFTANLTTQDGPGAEEEQQVLKVNAPVTIGGTNVYLVGNGYAPVVTVRDGEGDIAQQGPVVAVPSDGLYTSLLVIKAPDAQPDQLGFVGFFLPTAFVDEAGVSFSRDPDPFNPQLNLNSYYGDLGLDDGTPENVYVLDTDDLTELNSRTTDDGGIVLGVGQTVDLPEGKGSISFDGLQRYVALDIHHDPGQLGALVFSTLALLGLSASLFIGRRRLWVRTAEGTDGRILVEYGLLARGEDTRLAGEGASVEKALLDRWLVPDGPVGENGQQEAGASSTAGGGKPNTITKDNS
ncbi:cytochrome C biogenesis protein ResB [Arthrobacter sp. RIT-PI-e]|uniref:cytochrome c biogenesis protein ResB n=1 Tax=Arthrobacter sp. RIT-PI-e TaxID=1681197 RepID=UPI0006A156B7|nr:cytochrome c biogenesis protein ResB [Arthrobacter sp. RIT-PI-e]KNC20314.1 cytochrome C biogenesis protein ResB [Arthrobacter sp. RIT-PI-e]